MRAGVFPYLREENLLPVYVRLDYKGDSGSLRQQVFGALRGAASTAGIEFAGTATETLWEYFHRREVELWDERNQLIVPVIVFDQFEEIFTRGRTRQVDVDAFIEDIAALVTGRLPEQVRRRFESEPDASTSFDFTRRRYRIVLSVREDFLPQLETLRPRVANILDKRLRLEPMDGRAAHEVLEAGSHLLGPGASDAIVRFVAAPRASSSDGPHAPSTEHLVVEPALLSVVCRELNDKRRSRGEHCITTELLGGSQAEIIAGFYERSISDLPRARKFVEENLITDEGFRDSVSKEKALRAEGVSAGVLDELVDRRLIRVHRIGDVDHIELTHDLLTDVIRESRDERRRREEVAETEFALARTRKSLVRARVALAVFVVLLLAVLVAGAVAYMQRREAARYRHLIAQNAVSLAARLVDDGSTAAGLAHLANALRRDHTNLAAHRLVVGLLLERRWPVLQRTIEFGHHSVSLQHSANGSRLVVVDGGTAVIFDSATGRRINEIHSSSEISAAALDGSGRLLAIGDQRGVVQLWESDSGRERGEWYAHTEFVRTLALSKDGSLLASGANDGIVQLIHVANRTSPASVELRGMVYDLQFSGSGRWLATASKVPIDLDEDLFGEERSEAIVWETSKLTRVTPSMYHERPIWSVRFSEDEQRIVTASWDKTARIWSTADGSALGPPLPHSEKVYHAEFSPDGEYLVTASADRSARVWYVKWIGQLKEPPNFSVLQHSNEVVAAHFSRDGAGIITASDDGTVRCWTVDGRPLTEPIDHGSAVSEAIFVSGPAPVASLSKGTLNFWRFDGSAPEYRAAAGPLAVTGDGTAAITIGRTELQLVRLDSLVQKRVALNADCERSSLSPDGRLVACEKWKELNVLRTDTGRRIGPTLSEVQQQVDAIFTPDSRFVAIELPTQDDSDEQDVVVLDPYTGSRVAPPMRHFDLIYGKAFDPSGRFLVTASSDGLVRVWNWKTGKLLHTSGQQSTKASDIVSHAEFDATSKRIVYSSWNDTATIWRLATGKKVVVRHGSSVDHAAFSPDGKLVVTASWDLTARLWDSDTGAPVGEPMRHKTDVKYAAFSADGEKIVTLDKEGNARVWDANTGAPLTQSFRNTGEGVPSFARDGEILLTVDDSDLRLHSFHRTSAEDANLLADLAEAIGGYRIDENGALRPSGDRRQKLQQVASEETARPSVAIDIARWLITEPRKRSISPFSATTPADLARYARASKSRSAGTDVAILFPWELSPAEP